MNLNLRGHMLHLQALFCGWKYNIVNFHWSIANTGSWLLFQTLQMHEEMEEEGMTWFWDGLGRGRAVLYWCLQAPDCSRRSAKEGSVERPCFRWQLVMCYSPFLLSIVFLSFPLVDLQWLEVSGNGIWEENFPFNFQCNCKWLEWTSVTASSSSETWYQCLQGLWTPLNKPVDNQFSWWVGSFLMRWVVSSVTVSKRKLSDNFCFMPVAFHVF